MKKITLSLFLTSITFLGFSQIPTDSLIAFYSFTNNAENSVSSMHDGVVYGAGLTMDRFNNENSAYLFDGIDDYIEIADAPELRPSAITISVWVNLYEFNNTWHSIVSKFNQDDTGNGNYVIAVKDENNLNSALHYGTQCTNSDDWARDTAIMNWDLGEWQQIVLTYGDNTRRYYKNGVLIEENSLSAIINNCEGSSLKLGGNVWMSVEPQYLRGELDDIRIYSRVLSASEIEGLYNSESSPTTSTNNPEDIGKVISKIYPNPISGKLNVEINNNIDSEIYFSVRDVLGVEIKSGKLEYRNKVLTMDFSNEPNGIYHISFFDKENRLIKTSKFVKN
ncbi:MAG: LamG-like jellyroll fold domain-containing protein [Saprospiraceae bacterium]